MFLTGFSNAFQFMNDHNNFFILWKKGGNGKYSSDSLTSSSFSGILVLHLGSHRFRLDFFSQVPSVSLYVMRPLLHSAPSAL